MDSKITQKQYLAAELFTSGCNCAQAVAGAFAEEAGLSQQDMLSAAAAFGGGFARTRGLCGAVAGAGMVIGRVIGSAPDGNARVYQHVRNINDAFLAQLGTNQCGELLKNLNVTDTPVPDERTAEYYAKRPCARFVMLAAGLLQQELDKIAEE